MFLRLCATIVAVACSAFAYTRCAICLCLAAMLGACGGVVAECDDSEVVKTALSVVYDSEELVGLGLTGPSGKVEFTMADIVTVNHNDQTDKYTCRAQMTVTYAEEIGTPPGTAPFAYTVQTTGSDGMFYVEIENVLRWLGKAEKLRREAAGED